MVQHRFSQLSLPLILAKLACATILTPFIIFQAIRRLLFFSLFVLCSSNPAQLPNDYLPCSVSIGHVVVAPRDVTHLDLHLIISCKVIFALGSLSFFGFQ